MPVKSYLIIPQTGHKSKLANEIGALKGCEIHPAENQEVLILVTDTTDSNEEVELLEQIENNQKIKHITLVSGYE
ncbi:chaperone NapD [Reichenbachiella ulvae]|uniref:Chaperone NapD n=1 Tax=Reichenbachiella ulvae TaxID=2980104 RepID=A0ABT3CQX4_9BACT|nr:chaperone NapD [Reichenbachiella ulvae]MCV9385958.1 chaperone NapD [Reichenbachiella ulvae]